MLPWKETSVESERLRFIERVTAGEEPVTELCRQSGISRKTGYKLIHRYEAYGEDGLLDRSRAPHDHPNATPRELAKRIVEAKRAHPTWGPKKLIACRGLERPTGPETRRALARAFQEYGLPRSSGPTTARPSPASAWAASHPSPHGGSSSGSSPSASSRDTLNRTGVSSASTAPSRRRRRRRPGSTGDDSGEPSVLRLIPDCRHSSVTGSSPAVTRSIKRNRSDSTLVSFQGNTASSCGIASHHHTLCYPCARFRCYLSPRSVPSLSLPQRGRGLGCPLRGRLACIPRPFSLSGFSKLERWPGRGDSRIAPTGGSEHPQGGPLLEKPCRTRSSQGSPGGEERQGLQAPCVPKAAGGLGEGFPGRCNDAV